MKKALLYFSFLVTILVTSCSKGYTHEKTVTNNSREAVTVISGCCNNVEKYTIQPGESEIVFECVYQQISKPSKDELSWKFELIQEEQSIDLSNSELWSDYSKNHMLRYEYVVKD